VQLILALISQLTLADQLSADGWDCISSTPFWIAVWSPSAVYLILLFAILIIQLLYVKEQFGIKQEMLFVLGLSVSYVILFAVFAFVPGIDNGVRLRGVSYGTVAFMCLSHVINVAIPAWQMRHDSPKEPSMTKQGLEDLLNRPAGMQEFKQFAAEEFSAENVLFYQRCLALPNSISPAQRQARLWKIYELHCLSTSPLPLNLIQSTLRKIVKDFESARSKNEPVPEDVFDKAIAEVLILMFKDTYPRFLQSKRKQRDSRVGRWDQFAQGV